MWINLKFSTSVMWRHFRFLHMTDVENFWNYSTTCCFVAIYAVLSKKCFVAINALFCGETLNPKFICGEKMTNMRSVTVGSSFDRYGSTKVNLIRFNAKCFCWRIWLIKKRITELEEQLWYLHLYQMSFINMQIHKRQKDKNKLKHIFSKFMSEV